MKSTGKQLRALLAKERDFTPKEIEQLGHVVDADECAERAIYPAASGFAFYNTDPETGAKVDTGRVRFAAPEPVIGGKQRRYGQRAGSPVEAYYCPLFNWKPVLRDVNIPVLITEGEFKAATACKAGFATIGLGGVFNFASARRGQKFIPSLDKAAWKGRDVYIVFDSDAATNKQVQLAETRLALRLAERGARVHSVRLPHMEKV